jgi:hypothetical protein
MGLSENSPSLMVQSSLFIPRVLIFLAGLEPDFPDFPTSVGELGAVLCSELFGLAPNPSKAVKHLCESPTKPWFLGGCFRGDGIIYLATL